jgi:glycolate oxidase FAD binding subunit
MKFSHDRLAQWLAGEFGSEAVTNEPSLLAAHGVDGKQPSVLCFPGNPEQVAAALRLCSEAIAAVIPWGSGTAMSIGNPPREVDVVIGLERLNQLVEHDHANLTATVQCGCRLPALQEVVAQHNQFLPLDPPNATGATVGGIVATNLNGPRRSHFGSVRDLVIGMKVVLASGEQIKAGGKVVKNVAGYDMCKLLVGSLGTLGIITEVTLRTAPIPDAAATAIVSGALSDVRQFIEDLSHSKLLPSAVFLFNARASKATAVAQRDWHVAVWCEGFEQAVSRHLHEAAVMAQRIGLASMILRESDHRRLWDEMRDFPLQVDRLVYRIALPRSSTTEFIQTIHARSPAGLHPEIVGDALMGIVWISLDGDDPAVQSFAQLGDEARSHGGHGIILSAPTHLKRAIDVWGPEPPALPLMREIKKQFDPKSLLNPGRFVAGI